MNKQDFFRVARKYVLNKYLLTLLIFACIYAFIGDQSLVKRIKRARQIYQLEQQGEAYRKENEAIEHQLNILQQPDSLEKFAREQYYMHTPEEDIYVIDE